MFKININFYDIIPRWKCYYYWTITNIRNFNKEQEILLDLY